MTGSQARAFLYQHDYYCTVARHTGRVIFGQLWMPDPDIGIIMKAHYQDAIADAVNSVSPLAVFFKA